MKKFSPEFTRYNKAAKGIIFAKEFSKLAVALFYLLLFSILPASSEAEINSAFTVPPYTLHETIIGIEGWEMRNQEPHPVFTDPQAALVEDSLIVNTSQPTALNLKTLVRNPQIENLGDSYIVEAQFAVSFNSPFTSLSSFDGGLYFRLAGADAISPLVFGFDYTENGGLYFQSNQGKVIVLPKAEIQENVAYRFTFKVNTDTQTFYVVVVSANDPSFRYESEEMSFQEGFTRSDGKLHKVDGLHMGNNKPHALSVYIDYVKMTPSWE